MTAAVAAHGQHIVLLPTDVLAVELHVIHAGLAPLAAVATVVLGKLSRLAYELAIEISLVRIVDAAQGELQYFLHVGAFNHRFGEQHMETIPAGGCIHMLSLGVPGLAHAQCLPLAVVQGH